MWCVIIYYEQIFFNHYSFLQTFWLFMMDVAIDFKLKSHLIFCIDKRYNHKWEKFNSKVKNLCVIGKHLQSTDLQQGTFQKIWDTFFSRIRSRSHQSKENLKLVPLIASHTQALPQFLLYCFMCFTAIKRVKVVSYGFYEVDKPTSGYDITIASVCAHSISYAPFHTIGGRPAVRRFSWWQNRPPQVAPFYPSCLHYRWTATDCIQCFNHQ